MRRGDLVLYRIVPSAKTSSGTTLANPYPMEVALMPDRGIFTNFFHNVGNIPHGPVFAVLPILLLFSSSSRASEPLIDSLTASSTTVRPGETVSLVLDAHDPDCGDNCTSGCGLYLRADLTLWQVSGGSFTDIDNGESGSPYHASANWQAPPEEGFYSLSVQISDSGNFMCGGRQNAQTEVIIEVDENAGQAPVITSFSIDENPALAGMETGISAQVEDPQGDPVIFAFSALRGSVVPGPEGDAVYTAPEQAGTDTITCTVRDPGGASSSASIEIIVTTALPSSELAGRLITPVDVAVNACLDLVVADPGAGGILFVNPSSGQTVFEISLPGVRCLAVDPRGRILAGVSGQVLVLSMSGRMEKVLDPGLQLGEVGDIAIDPATGYPVVLYAQAGRVVLFDQDDSPAGAFGSRGEAPGQFQEALGITVSSSGDFLISDAVGGHVLRFSPSGDFLATISSSGNGNGELTRPAGVLQGRNSLFVSDAFQSRVAVFSAQGDFLEFLGSLGEGPGHFRSPMGMCFLHQPEGLAVASAASSSVEILRFDEEASLLPEASVEPAVFDFGDVQPGESSIPLSLILRNTGPTPIGVYNLQSKGPFEAAGECPSILQPGEHCTLSTVFQPIRSGHVRGLIRFFTSAGERSVMLEGRGVAADPIPEFSPASLDFGSLLEGQSSDARLVELSNSGGGELRISAPGLLGQGADQFEIVIDECSGVSLGASETCVIGLRFIPMIPGVHDALLRVEFDAPLPQGSVALHGEAFQAEAIPTLSFSGVLMMTFLFALSAWILLRKRNLPFLLIIPLLFWTSSLSAVDPPHWYFGMDCSSCHIGHDAPGGGLSTATGNSNLCLSCHVAGGLAGELPILPSHTLSTHHYDVVPDAPRWGSAMPENPEMANRIMDGKLVCSTCHDQHTAQAANRGLCRISTPEILTAFGSTGSPSVGGTYTGQGGASYLIEITIADAHFRYSKDGGLSWTGEADTGMNIPLDSGLNLSFSGGTFALGERWRFSASFPFLRLPLDQGDNVVGDRYCRECHSLWAMDYLAVENGSQWLSHPVGNGLGANGKGYDRMIPLDGNGVPQGSAGADGNHSNNYVLDAGGLVQCLSCHHIHYADSNTLTEDGP